MEQVNTGAEALAETRVRYPMEDAPFYHTVAVLDAWDDIRQYGADGRGIPVDNLQDTREQYDGRGLDLDRHRFSNLIESYKQEEPFDPFGSTTELEACSSVFEGSMAGDSGLLRPQRGREQIELELRGFEEDYVGYFQGSENAENRQIIRTVSSFRTLLKPFVKRLTNSNWRATIDPYMDKLWDMTVGQLDPAVMSPKAQQTARLLWKYDIIGELQWGNYDPAEHKAMREACPPAHSADLDDLMLVSYLCSAGAHTRGYADERWFTNRDVPEGSPERCEPAVLPIDDEINPLISQPGSLSRFFGRSHSKAPLRLDVASRRNVAVHLQCTERVKDLLIYYTEYKTLPGKVWSARLEVNKPGLYAKDVKRALDEYTQTTTTPMNVLIETNNETGEVTALTWVRDPRPDGSDPSDGTYNEAVGAVGEMYGMSRAASPLLEGDAYACIGLEPGYNVAGKSIDNATKSAMTIFSEYEDRHGVGWTIYRQQLYATWMQKQGGEDGQATAELAFNDETVLAVVGSLHNSDASVEDMIGMFSNVAADLAQLRYFGAAMDLGRAGIGTGANAGSRQVNERVFAMGS